MDQHLSEENLQIFAIGQQIPDRKLMQHIENCSSCRKQIASYQQLYTGIKEQPVSEFDFDLATAVLSNLPPVKITSSMGKFHSVLPVSLGVILVSISLYIFRKNITNITTGIPIIFLLISLLACICII